MLFTADFYYLVQMDSKLPIDIFENVMQLAVEGCKAVATYIREVCPFPCRDSISI